jgi:hypothetical protein
MVLTRVFNLSKENFEALCAFALNLIGDCMLKELQIVGKELMLGQAIPKYDDTLEKLAKVQVFAFADKLLQSLGEPSRYFIHKGDPPPIHIPA